jgi:hypothetical protein
LCQTERVWASRPAKKDGRSIEEKKNSNADVMYIRVPMFVMYCKTVVLFTCTLMRSRPDSNEGVKCETRSVGTNSKILGGQDKQGMYLRRRTSRRLSLSLE